MEHYISYLVAMFILVALSAYFSATETAYSSLNKTRLRMLAENGNKRAGSALALSENYDKLISTVLVGNNIVNISLASLGTVLFVKLYGDAGATYSTIIITILVLIFGEISPKSLAKDCPEQFAIFSAPFLKLLIIVLTPVNILFSAWKSLLAKLFHLDSETKMSQEELRLLVDEVQQDGAIDENEGELLKNVIEFTGIEAEDILTHRVDLEAVSIEASKSEIAEVFSTSKFSRILVYSENIDNIVGAIHIKDFYTSKGITDKRVEDIITPVIFVLRNEKINEMLQKLQKSKSHLAVVLDEYGGTYGIVTMEDILEEIVGEIWDEHDEVIEPVRKCGKDTYLVSGHMDFDDFCEYFSIDAESESTSLSGWVMEKLEKVPEKGESFDYENMTITVAKVDNHRIDEVKVVCRPDEKQEENNENE